MSPLSGLRLPRACLSPTACAVGWMTPRQTARSPGLFFESAAACGRQKSRRVFEGQTLRYRNRKRNTDN